MSNTSPFDRLHQAQQTALISILSGDPMGRAAALAQVTERTLRRWRRQPEFQAALAEARRDFFSACQSHINASAAAAFQTLVFTAGYPGNKSDQLKAATFLLNRVAPAKMSAEPSSKNAQRISRKRLRREFGRKRPDMSGPERTPADIAGLQTVAQGR